MGRPNLMIIGAGGVGAVAAHKAAQFRDDFGEIHLVSRSYDKVERILADVEHRCSSDGASPTIRGHCVDARDFSALIDLLATTNTQIALNLASPYCNETILDACIDQGVRYVDTAVAESEHVENAPAPWYSAVEWPRRERFSEQDLSGVLGIGFDPGVVNVFCAYAHEHLFDSIDSIDIVDVNGGDHGHYFATNFDPDVNLREIREDVVYWEDGAFRKIPHHSRFMEVTLPVVGTHRVYSMGHDELHSLPQMFPGVRRIEFWMGFGERYLMVFDVLNRLGLLSSSPVAVDGHEVAPLRVVKAVLPDPATLAENYRGSVCIGCDIRGIKDGRERRVFIYSTCNHRDCYEEIGSQAISYTTGVPAVAAARLLARDVWSPNTLSHVEQLDPAPFLDLMQETGIDWQYTDLPVDGSWPF